MHARLKKVKTFSTFIFFQINVILCTLHILKRLIIILIVLLQTLSEWAGFAIIVIENWKHTPNKNLKQINNFSEWFISLFLPSAKYKMLLVLCTIFVQYLFWKMNWNQVNDASNPKTVKKKESIWYVMWFTYFDVMI